MSLRAGARFKCQSCDTVVLMCFGKPEHERSMAEASPHITEIAKYKVSRVTVPLHSRSAEAVHEMNLYRDRAKRFGNLVAAREGVYESRARGRARFSCNRARAREKRFILPHPPPGHRSLNSLPRTRRP
jgi:hypothetical protein